MNSSKKMKEKRYEELSITDDFLFCKILSSNPKLCKQLLELILGEEIRELVCQNNQESIKMTLDAKGIRLDIYAIGEDGTVYNIEMQTTSNRNLPKRSRYYQGMIDLNLLECGADYNELRRSYIIFICTFDFFGRGIPVYTFENTCKEIPKLMLGDESTKIFLNPHGDLSNQTEEMKGFLKLIAGKTGDGEFAKALETEVKRAVENKEWEVEYMTLMQRDREKFQDGLEQGLEQGLQQGLQQGQEQATLAAIQKMIKKNYPKEEILELGYTEEQYVEAEMWKQR